jgi:hypothetical protein
MRTGLRRNNVMDRQVIVAGQSLGAGIRHLKEALQFYLPGYTEFNTAIGGSGYTGLKYGTWSFARSVQAGGNIVIVVHGEYDSYINATRATYAGYLNQWRDDYARELGKSGLKLIYCQASSQLYNRYGSPSLPDVVLGQWDMVTAGYDEGVYCFGPKYQFPYNASDHTHLTADGYSWLGQKYAQIIGRVVTTGTWRPLYPTSIDRVGAAVTINLNVPVGPLVFDTTTLAAHPNGDYGLSYEDAGGTIAIDGTPVIAGNTITFNLTGTPSTSPRVIRYGYWPAAGTTPVLNADSEYSYAAGGMVFGNIRDSDTVAQYVDGNAYQMGNWLVHFEMAVP